MQQKPNILFLLAEDMCPNLGCYGDVDAITPNLDELSNEGIRYTNANSAAPVCSAARSTLALGVYPFSVGVHNHRSNVLLPENIKVIAKYMSDLGYFTAINKTDYNFVHKEGSGMVEDWDTVFSAPYFGDDEEIANCIKNTWREKSDKPFFFMHTFACTHQSRYGFPNDPVKHRETYAPRTSVSEYRDRSKLTIPKYHPDTPETREIWGQYHEVITAMDRMVGETIEHLKNDGLYEDTIIVFVGDNGMGIPGGKANMWNEGIYVPLIVRVPEKYQHLVRNYQSGSVQSSAVSFVDLPRTFIELAGGNPPSHMHGKNFLTHDKFEKYSYSFRNRIDSISEFVRIAKSEDFIYIRNFFPQRGWRFSAYMEKMAPYFTSAWEKEVIAKGDKSYNRKNAFFLPRKPMEELYDLKNDPCQMNNLALDPLHRKTLLEMRSGVINFMANHRDLGFIPETELARLAKENNTTAFEIAQDEEKYPFEEIFEFVNKVVDNEMEEEDIEFALKHKNPIMRYWGIQTVCYFEDRDFVPTLRKLLEDENASVKFAAAEALLNLSEDLQNVIPSKEVLKGMLHNKDNVMLPLDAADCLFRLKGKGADLIEETKDLYNSDNFNSKEDNGRYIAAITDIIEFYAEKEDKPFSYENSDPKMAERLLVIRDLKKS